MRERSPRIASVISSTVMVLLAWSAAAQEARPVTWLDAPLTNWNKAGATLPAAPDAEETLAAIVSRCKLKPPETTAAERAVKSAGWITFWNVDQQLVRDDVEVVGGMRGADGMCRPVSYQLFVFVGGRFAGTLSPTPMSSRLDASSGVVRVAPPQISTEFSRYTKSDPLCCPSARMTVRYRIDRGADGPLVVPVDVRTTRG